MSIKSNKTMWNWN